MLSIRYSPVEQRRFLVSCPGPVLRRRPSSVDEMGIADTGFHRRKSAGSDTYGIMPPGLQQFISRQRRGPLDVPIATSGDAAGKRRHIRPNNRCTNKLKSLKFNLTLNYDVFSSRICWRICDESRTGNFYGRENRCTLMSIWSLCGQWKLN